MQIPVRENLWVMSRAKDTISITKFGSINFDCENRIEWVKLFIRQSLVMRSLLTPPVFEEAILVVVLHSVLLSTRQRRVGLRNLLTKALHL